MVNLLNQFFEVNLLTVGVPMITAVSRRKIFFEPNAAVTIQEQLQLDNFFEEVA